MNFPDYITWDRTFTGSAALATSLSVCATYKTREPILALGSLILLYITTESARKSMGKKLYIQKGIKKIKNLF